jgi:uncharacterized membrane protein YphA (DoxX/SURF4 family)
MSTLLTIARIIVGVLFIFSGLVKANDPLGLSYKMHEYFEAWNMIWLNDYALAFALVMNVFEVVAGVAVLIGWRMKLVGWLLLLLIVFFTFLTGYAAYSGKFSSCGCFGDCIPLKPIQSFWKDVILLVLILFLLFNHKRIKPITSAKTSIVFLILSILLITGLQWYVMSHLPLKDCLPFKVGNNILDKMKMPADAIPDEYEYIFKYKKNGKEYDFHPDSLPDDIDTYEVEREQKLVKKGNDLKPAISDFSLVTQNETDTTEAILSQQNKYVLIFITGVNDELKQKLNLPFINSIKQKGIPVFFVAAEPIPIDNIPVLKSDATVIKTAARVNPTYFLMQGANIIAKHSYAQTEQLMEKLK